jgi:hypothetical protein
MSPLFHVGTNQLLKRKQLHEYRQFSLGVVRSIFDVGVSFLTQWRKEQAKITTTFKGFALD